MLKAIFNDEARYLQQCGYDDFQTFMARKIASEILLASAQAGHHYYIARALKKMPDAYKRGFGNGLMGVAADNGVLNHLFGTYGKQDGKKAASLKINDLKKLKPCFDALPAKTRQRIADDVYEYVRLYIAFKLRDNNHRGLELFFFNLSAPQIDHLMSKMPEYLPRHYVVEPTAERAKTGVPIFEQNVVALRKKKRIGLSFR